MSQLGSIDPRTLTIRTASRDDVPMIMYLSHAGGPEGKPRGVLPDPLPDGCYQAFDRIIKSSHDRLMVAELDGRVVGTFHLTYLTYLAGMGHPDAQVEAVHVHPDYRGRGVGACMMQWVIAQAKEKHCRRVQLTSNKLRLDAHRFYERLGFEASHQGMKLQVI